MAVKTRTACDFDIVVLVKSFGSIKFVVRAQAAYCEVVVSN